MRWEAKPKAVEFDTRTVHRFLLFPRRIGDEWRWLEWAWVKQVYRIVGYSDGGSGVWTDWRWARYKEET